MKTKSTKLLFCIALFALFGSLQGQINEMWTTRFESEILWQEVTSLGNLITCTNNGIFGIDPASGDKIWMLEQFAGLPRESLIPVEQSPFISIATADATYLFEPFGGKIVFDSRKANVGEIDSEHFLYQNNGILIVGKKVSSADPIMVMADMGTGEVRWTLEEKFGRIVAVNELSDKEILIVTLFNNYKLNSQTGDVIWKNLNSKEAESLDKMGAFGNLLKAAAEKATEDMEINLKYYRHPDGDVFYIASEDQDEQTMGQTTTITYTNIYNAYRVNDGSMLWSSPLEVNGKIGEVVFDKDGMIVLPDNGNRTKINKFDYTTKEGKWGKKGNGIAIKGGVYDYTVTNEGILLVTQAGDNDFLNFLDPQQGLITFDKPVKISGRLVGTMTLPKGIFYITNEEVNILSPATGELLLGKSVQTTPALTAEKGDLIYVFDLRESILKAISKSDATIRDVTAAAIKFEGREKPTGIELRESGILVNSEQNVVLIGYDGNIIYSKYLDPPREPGLKRALLYAQAARAAYIGAVSYYASGAMQAAAPEVKQDDAVAGAMVDAIGQAYGQLGDAATDFAKSSFKQANARFKATAQGRDFMIILTQKDKLIELLKVNKDTGAEEGSIDLGKEREPEYAVDDVIGQVFLRVGSTTLVSYKL